MAASLSLPQPPWTGSGKNLESLCRKALHQFDLLPADGKVAVALSGGKDSLTLLFMLKAISGRGFPPLDLRAIYISGDFSCGAAVQQNYLETICKALEVPLLCRTSDVKLPKLECYPCSRLRRKLLFETAREQGCSTIAFGHHSDDSAHTLFMNLMQKGEFATMLPKLQMVKYGVTIIRPLILVSEEEIIQFAQQHGFRRITCQCPVGQNSMRKKVAQLIKECAELFPHARSNLAQAGLLHGSEKARHQEET